MVAIACITLLEIHASVAYNGERWSCMQCKMSFAGLFMHNVDEDIRDFLIAPSHVALCCIVMMHKCLAERHVRPSV